VFKSLSAKSEAPAEYERSGSENRAEQNGDILLKTSNDSESFSVVCGHHMSNEDCMGNIFRKIMVRALEVKMFTQRVHVPPSVIINQKWCIKQR
jgi:hypothetical protein